jgi:serine/threonine-protein kinase RsbW
MATRADTRPILHDVVELDVPAEPAYLAVLRTATAGLAARLNLSLDEIEDLRIAVDEAGTLLLDDPSGPIRRAARDGGAPAMLRASFSTAPHGLDILIQGPATTLPDRTNYAWAVLQALAGAVTTGSSAAGSWIRLARPEDRGTR